MKVEELTKAIIKYIGEKDNKDEPYIYYDGKVYSLNDVKNEVENQTEFGKRTESNILALAVDLFVERRSKRCIDCTEKLILGKDIIYLVLVNLEEEYLCATCAKYNGVLYE